MGGLYLHGSHHAHRQLQLCQTGPTLLLYIYIEVISYIYIDIYRFCALQGQCGPYEICFAIAMMLAVRWF